MQAVIGKKLVLENQILENYGLYLEDGKIAGIASVDAIDKNQVEIISDQAEYILPGFIDVHIHGSAGMDVMDGTAEALSTIRNSLVTTGTTAFLATTMTVSEAKIEKALKLIEDQMTLENSGAKVLGAHLEGPFIHPKAKGAHLLEFIQSPNRVLVETYKNVIKLITLAPETDEGHGFIQFAKELGIRTSLGHTTCSYEEARSAIDSGADSVTHLFNAMSGLHHRDPGLVGAALLTDVYTELIADNVHVHPDLYELIYRLKGEDRMILITDAMRGQCMKKGVYDLGGQAVEVSEKDARLTDGTLAGSILTQNLSLKNVMKSRGMDIVKVSKMLSQNPANLLGITDLGAIKRGNWADLVLLNEHLDLCETIINGKSVYRRSL